MGALKNGSYWTYKENSLELINSLELHAAVINKESSFRLFPPVVTLEQ